MPVQPQLVLLQKNMMMAEGVSRSLDPNLNIWLLAEPLIAGWVRRNRGPHVQAQRAAQEIHQMLVRLPHLARQADSVLDRLAEASREGAKTAHEARVIGPSVWLSALALLVALAALLF
jgi:ubiquinone biosynthesis protein